MASFVSSALPACLRLIRSVRPPQTRSHDKTNTMKISTLILGCAFASSLHAADPKPVEAWKAHSSDEYGIVIRYPTQWKCYEAENRGPYQSMWDRNQFVFCVHPDNPSINFNIRLARGTPPRPFAEKMKTVLTEMSHQFGGEILSFRPLSIADNESAELVHTYKRGNDVLQQRMVVVSRPSVGFIWTFTAPKAVYDSLNKEVFEQVIMQTVFSEPKPR